MAKADANLQIDPLDNPSTETLGLNDVGRFSVSWAHLLLMQT